MPTVLIPNVLLLRVQGLPRHRPADEDAGLEVGFVVDQEGPLVVELRMVKNLKPHAYKTLSRTLNPKNPLKTLSPKPKTFKFRTPEALKAKILKPYTT